MSRGCNCYLIPTAMFSPPLPCSGCSSTLTEESPVGCAGPGSFTCSWARPVLFSRKNLMYLPQLKNNNTMPINRGTMVPSGMREVSSLSLRRF